MGEWNRVHTRKNFKKENRGENVNTQGAEGKKKKQVEHPSGLVKHGGID
jgi:hypothetical protein